MANAADYAIRVIVQQEVSKELDKIRKEVEAFDSRIKKIEAGEKAFTRTAGAAEKLSKGVKAAAVGFDDLIQAQQNVREAQDKYNKALSQERALAKKQKRDVDFHSKALVARAEELQRSKESLKQLQNLQRQSEQENAKRLRNEQRQLAENRKELLKQAIARKELSNLNRQATALNTQLGVSFNRLTRAQLAVRNAQQIYNDTLRNLTLLAKKSGTSVDFQNQKLIQAQTVLNKAKDNLRKLNQEYKEAKKGSRGFFENLALQRQGMLDLSRRLDIAVKKIISYRIAFGIFREARDAFQDMFVQAINMDDVLGDLQKVLRGTQADIERLRDAAFEFGIAFGRSPKEIAEGFKIFAQQGLDVNGIIERTNALMLAVSATTLNTKEAIKALTVAAKNFGDQFDNLSVVVDKFLASERLVPVAAKDFADALATVGQAAKIMGLNLDELNGIVAAVGAVTQRSGRFIGTAFRTILSRATSDDAIESFQKLGIAVLKSSDEFRPFGDIIRDLHKQWGDLDEVQKKNIARVLGQRRRYTAFLALMNNFNDFLKVTEASQNAFNDATVAAQVEIDKYRRRVEQINTAFSELKESVGRDLINSLFNIAKGFDTTLQVISSNSGAIAGLIKGIGLLIGVYGGLRILLFIIGGLFKARQIDLLTLTKTTQGATAATIQLAGAYRVLRIASGPVLLAISILASIIVAYKSSTDKAAKSTENLNKLLRENEQAALDSEERLAKLRGTLNEFAKIRAMNQINEQLSQLQIELIAANRELENLERTRTGVRAGGGILGLGELPRKATPEEVETIIKQKEAIRLLEAQSRSLRAQLDKTAGREALPKDLAALELEKVELALERIIRTSNKLRKIRTGGFFEGLSLKDLGFITNIGFVEKLTDQARDEIEKALARAVEDVERKRNQIFLRFVLDPGDKSDEILTQRIKLFTKLQEKIFSLQFQIDNLGTTIRTKANIAKIFGESFNEVESELEVFKKGITDLQDELFNLGSQRDTLEKQLREEFKIIVLETGEIRKQALSEDDKLKIEKELDIVNKSILHTNEKLAEVYDKHGSRIHLLTELRNRQLLKESEISLLTTRQNEPIQRQINLLRSISSSLTGTSRNRLVNNNVLQKQIALETEIANLEHEKTKNSLNNTINSLRQEGIEEDAVEIQTLKNKLLEEEEKHHTRIFDIINKTTENLVRENVAIQNTVKGAISAGFAEIPRNIAERKRLEEELAIRRKELEFELAEARRAGDQNAINQAIRGLQEIEIEAKRIGNVLSDVFNAIGKVAEIRFQKLTEVLVDELTNIEIGRFTAGEHLADTIALNLTEANLDAAKKLQSFTFKGHVDGGKAAALQLEQAFARAGLQVEFQVEKGHITGINIASTQITQAHETGALAIRAGILAGAQALGQVLGGGGAGAGIGAGFGGIAGGILGGLLKLEPTGAGAIALAAGASLLGGLIGGKTDKEPEFLAPISKLTDAVDKNTIAIQNNNRLLELNRQFINVPARFIPSPTQGFSAGGIQGGLNVNIYASQNQSPTDIATATVSAIENAFDSSLNRGSSRAPSFGR